MAKSVIFTMVGKGGVGKSTTSIWLHQFLVEQGVNVQGYDMDPDNATYDAFDGLNTQHISVYNKRREIDKSLFDDLVENHLLQIPDNTVAIVDNGATTFNALLTYMSENTLIDLLAEHGITTYISIPVAGGSEHYETLKGLVALHEEFNCPKIIWLNHYFGAMPEGDEDPATLLPQLLGDSLAALIDIPDYNADTFGKAIEEMQRKRKTFDEFYQDGDFGLMMRNRIKNFKATLWAELDGKLPFAADGGKGSRSKKTAEPEPEVAE